MKKMYFIRLTIISKTAKKAAQFDFSKSYNLILSNEKNSVGKSSLVKSIFWSFGCEPQFDDKWKSLDCRAILDFEIEGKPYQIARQGTRFILKEDHGKYQVFTSVGGNFSTTIMSILSFNALLPVQDKDEIATPPPAYYFVPFYIDQKQSWANAWASFNNLGQFPNWKRTIISYHTGMIGKGYFDTTQEIYSKKVEITEARKQIDRLDTAISVVNEFPSESNLVINDDELNQIEEQLSVEIMDVHYKQEILFEELASLRAEKAHINSQIILAENSFKEANDDYEFSESLDDDIECPTCGVTHDNSIVNRFSLLQDKMQAEDMINRLNQELKILDAKIVAKVTDFEAIKEQIQKLDEKYSTENGASLSTTLETIASKAVIKKVESNKSSKVESLHALSAEESALTKNRTSASKDKRKKVKEKFQEYFPRFLSKLKAFGVNSSSIQSPENYTKVAASGGAAESTRAMLAYYVSIYNLINNYGEHVLCPFVIDTPNQHEQAEKHYDSIVSLLLNELPEESQLFLCGMNSEKLEPLKKQANVIYLDAEHSLLNSDCFERLNAQYSEIFELESDEK